MKWRKCPRRQNSKTNGKDDRNFKRINLVGSDWTTRSSRKRELRTRRKILHPEVQGSLQRSLSPPRTKSKNRPAAVYVSLKFQSTGDKENNQKHSKRKLKLPVNIPVVWKFWMATAAPRMQGRQTFRTQRESNFNPEFNSQANYHQALGYNNGTFQIGKDAAPRLRKLLTMSSSKIEE